MRADLMAAGHAWHLEESRRHRYRATCECGYVSTYRLTEIDAVRAGLHHLDLIVQKIRASGVSVPPNVTRAS